MQNIWTRAKEISVLAGSHIDLGAPSPSCFGCTNILIKKRWRRRVETNWINACAELRISGSIFTALLEEVREQQGHCNEISLKVRQCVSSVYQKLLKRGESLGDINITRRYRQKSIVIILSNSSRSHSYIYFSRFFVPARFSWHINCLPKCSIF